MFTKIITKWILLLVFFTVFYCHCGNVVLVTNNGGTQGVNNQPNAANIASGNFPNNGATLGVNNQPNAATIASGNFPNNGATLGVNNQPNAAKITSGNFPNNGATITSGNFPNNGATLGVNNQPNAATIASGNFPNNGATLGVNNQPNAATIPPENLPSVINENLPANILPKDNIHPSTANIISVNQPVHTPSFHESSLEPYTAKIVSQTLPSAPPMLPQQQNPFVDGKQQPNVANILSINISDESMASKSETSANQQESTNTELNNQPVDIEFLSLPTIPVPDLTNTAPKGFISYSLNRDGERDEEKNPKYRGNVDKRTGSRNTKLGQIEECPKYLTVDWRKIDDAQENENSANTNNERNIGNTNLRLPKKRRKKKKHMSSDHVTDKGYIRDPRDRTNLDNENEGQDGENKDERTPVNDHREGRRIRPYNREDKIPKISDPRYPTVEKQPKILSGFRDERSPRISDPRYDPRDERHDWIRSDRAETSDDNIHRSKHFKTCNTGKFGEYRLADANGRYGRHSGRKRGYSRSWRRRFRHRGSHRDFSDGYSTYESYESTEWVTTPTPDDIKPPTTPAPPPPVHVNYDCTLIKMNNRSSTDGVYTLRRRSNNQTFEVWCDMARDGGGWTVFQKRGDFYHKENFFRGWNDYRTGFGDNKNEEYWLGLDIIYEMTAFEPQSLRIDLADFDGKWKFAKYETFSVGTDAGRFKLSAGYYSGDAGDSLAYHNNRPFSTKDAGDTGCPNSRKGAWWYYWCHYSNLNGQNLRGKHGTYGDGINWYGFRGLYYSLKVSEMKMRPRWFS